MNSTATRIENLSAEKRALLSSLLKKRGRVHSEAIPKRHTENRLPLSFAQERMWFLAQLDPGNPNYNVAGAIRISGRLNIPLLEQCVNEVVRRHEVLRTTFRSVNGRTEQTLLSNSRVPVSLLDLSGLPLHDKDAEQDKLIMSELQKPFVLAGTTPLLRMTLLLRKPQEFMLLLSMHHIVSDEWSLRLLISDIGQLYQTFLEGGQSLLPELAIQYADYAGWQRSKSEGETRDKQLGYWLNLLAEAPQILTLPSDYPRPPIQTNRGAIYSVVLPQELSEGIVRLSRALDMTLFMTLMGAFSILLHRYTSLNDLCIGYPATNRNKPELEKLIGFFVNTLVLRTQVAGNPLLADFLTEVRRNLLDAQKYQDFPFEQLVEELNPERNLGHHPVFQVMFSYQNSPLDLPEISGLNVQLMEGESITAKFDLTLLIAKTADSMVCAFEYSTERFEEKNIAQMAGHFETLLAGMVSQPGIRIAELPLLPQLERKQLLVDWNATAADYSAGQCLHSLFEAQAEKTPDADAVAFSGRTLSYAELNAKANQLAHYLRARGVGPDMPVGLCVERSFEMAVGMLGILKAGGAYVPIDPHYPAQRIGYMLDDAQIAVLLTQQALAGTLPHSAKHTICLDSDGSAIGQCPTDNPAPCNHQFDLAYIIYTSGSTGVPKGVTVSHRNAVHSTTARFAHYREQVSAYLLLSSFAFDSSVAGLFWTLGQGGCLCLPTDDAAKDPTALAGFIKNRRVSHLLALPCFYALLLKQTGDKLQSLKTAIVAGEACSTEVVRQHCAALPDVPLYNEYGPTEGSVWSSVYLADRDDLDRPLSIGRPISNVRLYILDRSGNPVPVGVPGELHIGGTGVVRGYWRRPELTAEKFIPDPFQNDGGRLYKTGDLARYRADGNIEFLGRIDDQVKIRGFRIELGEIEARLVEQPGVDEAAVLVRENQPGNKQLVAYVVGSGTLTAEVLRCNLKAALPDYMLPGAIAFLERMPLTANGKIDRKALPEPDMAEAASNRYVAPETETEKALAAIWSGILGVERVGRHDDFFGSGGHSLLAAQLPAAVQKQFNIRLPLKSFFEMPTVEAQARLIDTGESGAVLVDLEAEAVLGAEISPLPSVPVNVATAKALLLTGATGFLGTFLLAELLQQTDAKIYCLVRAADERQALTRLQRQLGYYELQDGIDWSRVIAVCGDLAEPRLGLSALRYEEIAGQVEVIYHNGALVNFIQPYKALKAANVSGTEAVLRLACYRKAKAVHYVSTLSVFSEAPARPQGYQENDEPKFSANLGNGYAQSKWVAEKLVKSAGDRGFQVSIYRPATVAGDSRSGIWNTEDFVCRLIKACIQLGYAPVERIHMDIAPVDNISRAIIALSLLPDAIGGCFHLNHPVPPYSDQLIDGFSRAGYRLERVPYRDWLEKVLEAGEAERKDFALLPLLSMFSDQIRNGQTELLEEDAIRYDCTETQAVLSMLGIECALLDGELLARYQAYFKHSGFVLEPANYQRKLF
jgi:amino acid adenylation domain-containing protein/thioester reductase-like protein